MTIPQLETKTPHFENFIKFGEVKSLAIQPDKDGGVLVPQHMVTRFNDLLKEYSVIRNIARVDTVSTDSLEIVRDKDYADCGWVEEKQDREETKTPELIKQKIWMHELYAKPRATQKLIEDAAIDIESWVTQKIAERMAWMENEAFIKGNGEHKPFGFLHYAEKGIEHLTGHGSDFFLKVESSLPSRFTHDAVWVMSPSALAYVRHLKEEHSGRYLWQHQFADGQPATLLGHHVYVSEQMPPATDPCSIAFGSFYQGYQIVDRMNLSIMRDPYSAKPFVEFYARKRVGGDVIEPAALKLISLEAQHHD